MSLRHENFSLSQGLGINSPTSLKKAIKNDAAKNRNFEDDDPLMRFATGLSDG